MKLLCLGVGEAWDPSLGSASYLVIADKQLLIDCGYGVPKLLFEAGFGPDDIDALYLTHFHADHTFGIPPVFGRWTEEKRQKPFTIIGQPGTEERVKEIVNLAYGSLLKNLSFELRFIETTDQIDFGGLELSFAKSSHPMTNYAIRVQCGNAALGVSGDGGLTDDTRALFSDCSLLVHEAYTADIEVEGHTTAKAVIEYAKTSDSLTQLVLVHINRDQRRQGRAALDSLVAEAPLKIAIPEPGDSFEVKAL